MTNLPSISDAKGIDGKKIFLRGDIDVPLRASGNGEQEVGDDSRLNDIWPTIEFLLGKNCTVYLAGHLGRPEGKEALELSSRPVAEWILGRMQSIISNSKFEISNQIQKIQLNNFQAFKVAENLTVLENLRFDPGEEGNDPEFAKKLAGLAEIYVNEAFAASEREHASIVGVAMLLPHFAGLRLVKEVQVLEKLLMNPERPLLAVIGGAKLETKIPIIGKMAVAADGVVVGGKLLTEIMAGSDLMKDPKIRLLKLTDNEMDTTLESIDEKLQGEVAAAATIVWNGPVGQVEEFTYQVGTRRIGELIAGSKAYKVVGGGDTVGFLKKLGILDRFDWVSSGGGAMLKFLAGEKLPGVEALLA